MNQSEYELYEHKPVKTSQEADEVRPNFSSNQGAKAIILRAKYAEERDKFVMLVLPGNLRFDNSRVRDLLKAQDYRFADKEEITKETDGVKIGGIPPFGNLFDMQVYADPKILQNEKNYLQCRGSSDIHCHASK